MPNIAITPDPRKTNYNNAMGAATDYTTAVEHSEEID